VVIGKLKNNKAPGIDNIQAELLKHDGQNLILFYRNYLTWYGLWKKIPDEWKTGIICALYKKVTHCIVPIIEASSY
jgi:hypothetical protein